MRHKIGDRFGRLEIVEDTGKRDYKAHIIWKCHCHGCGNDIEISSKNLYNDNIQSCGCCRRDPPEDLTGREFGMLTVIEEDSTLVYAAGHLYWRCQCACNNEIMVSIPSHHLLQGRETSCGCHKKKNLRSMMERRWESMIKRCYDPDNINYKYYGFRGIRVHKRWRLSFDNFLADLGYPPTRHTLGRINNDGNYSPDNCRWETIKKQNNNKSDNRWIILNGIRKTISQWSDEKGEYVKQRIYEGGWDDQTALTAPEGVTRFGAYLKYDELDF